MHALHTTEAFVLGSIPHGESNRVLRLFTRDLGYLYAHGQGVRDVRNRNRFALTTGQRSLVTLVRGRETWRITGAQSLESVPPGGGAHDRVRAAQVRKVFSLFASLAPRETRLDGVYELLADIRHALHACDPQSVRDVETVSVLRILHRMGYIARPQESAWPEGVLASTEVHPELMAWVSEHRKALLRAINEGLASANT